MIDITYDPAKNARNIEKRGLSFEMVKQLEWDTAIFQEDDRYDYGELRIRVFGMIEDRVYTIVYTPRGGKLRIISFRKANDKEIKRYDEEKEARSLLD